MSKKDKLQLVKNKTLQLCRVCGAGFWYFLMAKNVDNTVLS